MMTIALKQFRPSAVLALLAAAAALPATSCKKEAAPPPPPPSVVVLDITATNVPLNTESTGTMVAVMSITTTNVPLNTEFIGQLDSPQNVEIRARVEAFVKAMPFIVGTNVVQGELLFALDDGPYQQKLAAATTAAATPGRRAAAHL